MGYTVIRPFKDLSDPKQHDYAVGDAFPREGYKPTDTFTNGLLTGANSAGSIFVVVADTTEDTAEATEDSTLTEEATEEKTPAEEEAEATEEKTPAEEEAEAAEEETPAEEETETTEEEVSAEKPKRKCATKKVEE